MGELEQGVVTGGPVVLDGQVSHPPRGEIGVEDAGLVSGLDDERQFGQPVGEGGILRARDGGHGRLPGFPFLFCGVLPAWERRGIRAAVGFVGGSREALEVSTAHHSMMPEVPSSGRLMSTHIFPNEPWFPRRRGTAFSPQSTDRNRPRPFLVARTISRSPVPSREQRCGDQSTPGHPRTCSARIRACPSCSVSTRKLPANPAWSATLTSAMSSTWRPTAMVRST